MLFERKDNNNFPNAKIKTMISQSRHTLPYPLTKLHSSSGFVSRLMIG